jgi:hypothetical protein
LRGIDQEDLGEEIVERSPLGRIAKPGDELHHVVHGCARTCKACLEVCEGLSGLGFKVLSSFFSGLWNDPCLSGHEEEVASADDCRIGAIRRGHVGMRDNLLFHERLL